MLYSIPPRNVPGKDSLAYWDGFITNDEINLILAQPEWLSMQSAEVGGSSDNGIISPEIRKSNVAWLSTKPELYPIWDKLSRAVAEVNSRYFHFDLTGFYEPMQLTLYTDNNKDHYNWHTDAGPTDTHAPRKLSMSMLLNDEAQTLDYVKGRAWFFPSYTLHRVAPVTRGIRRSLVLWIGGPPFR